MSTVPLIRPLGLNSFGHIESFYHQVVDALQGGQAREAIHCDLSVVSFVPPEGILALVSAARLWYLVTGYPIHLHNLRPDVHRYLERMDLFSQCGNWIRVAQELADADRLSRSTASQRLLEVLPIASEETQNAQDVTDALARASLILMSWFAADADAVTRLLTMLSEITTNVVHSLDRGFAVMQRYRDNDAVAFGSQVTIAVGDLGIGIQTSLRRKENFPRNLGHQPRESGSDYILHALELGVTSRDTVGGMGLYRVRTLVHGWNGSLRIRSARSAVRISGSAVDVADDLAEIPGTQVVISVRGSLVGS